ncbi:MAG TPA: argininosuccinate synthase domain-containing protein [Actinomycetota bacterium]|nr:argininosuccinate synthase domain-containing protein [Actinomycetota bacterium]
MTDSAAHGATRDMRVGMCQSGGLSALTVALWLTEQGYDVVNFVADIGQASPGEVASRAGALEAAGLAVELVDLRAEMAETCFDLVRYQASYDGGYWNTTGAARAVLVAGLSPVMRARGCGVLAHGCVGGGNDQRRFDRYTRALAPDLATFVPWTRPEMLERFPSRAAMVEYVTTAGLDAEAGADASYSIDANLGGISHEHEHLEDLTTPVTFLRPLRSAWPQDAPDAVEKFAVTFEHGRAVAVGGAAASPLECMLAAGEVAARNGVWLRNVVENRIAGTKCRGVYEAPALELLGRCASELYQVTLDERSQALFAELSRLLARHVYEGRYFEPSARAARLAADAVTEAASGTVEVDLYKGNVTFHSVHGYGDAAVRERRFGAGGHRWEAEADPEPVAAGREGR